MGRRAYVPSSKVFNIDRKRDLEALNVVAARMASRETLVLARIAKKIEARAKAIAAAHYHSGRYERGVKAYPVVTHQGIVDWVVAIDREVVGPIEFGHYMGPHKMPGRPWVPGIHALHRAALTVMNGG